MPPVPAFHPTGVPYDMMQTVVLTVEELEVIRLVDFEGLDQDGAAMRMGVSRTTLSNDLRSARHKVASALISGSAIRIEGGSYVLRGENGRTWR
ncbi:MAG: DUF134 domain-containing protein [Thermoplasmata archaeon]|nr:DUF134 domain-containing protein [Thermoplasmata archaeon]